MIQQNLDDSAKNVNLSAFCIQTISLSLKFVLGCVPKLFDRCDCRRLVSFQVESLPLSQHNSHNFETDMAWVSRQSVIHTLDKQMRTLLPIKDFMREVTHVKSLSSPKATNRRQQPRAPDLTLMTSPLGARIRSLMLCRVLNLVTVKRYECFSLKIH